VARVPDGVTEPALFALEMVLGESVEYLRIYAPVLLPYALTSRKYTVFGETVYETRKL
jgi:hypothetical protein